MADTPQNGQASPRKEAQKAQALKLHMAGFNYVTIGEELGISRQMARKRVMAAFDDCRPHADVEAYRAVQVAELTTLRITLRKAFSKWGISEDIGIEEMLAIADKLLKLHDREARLLGLDRAATPQDTISGLSDAELEAVVKSWVAADAKA